MYSVWKNTCFPLIGYLLINIIHGLYYIYLLVYSVYCSFLRRTRLLYHEITLQSRNTHTYGNKDVKFLSKLPKHLAIIIGAENIFYKDLVKLILWCSQFGVQFISFYQKNNNIQPHLLYETFYKYNKESVRKVVWNKSFEHLKEQVKQDLNGYTMCDPSEQLHVNIFRTNDGLDYLVEMTKDLSKLTSYSLSPSSSSPSLSSLHSDITQELINDLIFKKINVPDPDVALVIGDTCSSFGFLPWHLRVTEFVHFHSHHKITSRDFIVLLEKYSNCEQRFGK